MIRRKLPLPPPWARPCLATLGLVGVLGACAQPQPTPQQRASVAACRDQAEQEFLLRNRSGLYQPDNSLTPYAVTAPQAAAIQGLANQYDHRQMVEDCLRGASGPAPIGATPPPGH
jgi:hypothetical protein